MKKFSLLILLFSISFSANFAQKLNYVQGQLLVQPRANVDVRQWAKQWTVFEGRKTNFQIKKQVSQPMNVWLVTFDYTKVSEFKLLDAIRQDKAIEIAQLNHRLELRSTLPNDPQINMQWQYLNVGQSGGTVGADLDMDLAWDITTGGVTATGDTIVVCVIDDGLSETHPDFGNNIWVNRAEVPNNGKDDDGNGFIDDYRGWNTGLDNDQIYDRANHGTPVAAIIGAKGNNGIGISGINWNVKLMIVKSPTSTESEIIEAYSYPLTMRKRFNQTNGQQGAFVVATNSSWGQGYLFPQDAPLWCAMYDSLGTQGILNAGATTNEGVDIDMVGDLPSNCPSDYLIVVTNIDDNNILIQDAGYGATSVDLAAYGTSIWTAQAPNSYGTFDGTSAATPHVAGAIGLLYSAPCAGFASLYKSDPKAAALLMRQFILEGAVYTPSSVYRTVTQGRLNVNNSLKKLMAACSDCFPPTSLSATDITDIKAKLTWSANNDIQRIDLRWRAVGAANWNETTNVSSPFALSDLLACTDYEFQLKAYCMGDTLDYTQSFTFKTDGCCVAPTGLQVSSIGTSIASLHWDKVLAAQSYTVQIRPENTTEWNTYNPASNSLLINNLTQCTRYEIQLNTICNGEPSDFSPSYYYQTPGCGACKDLQYCVPRKLDASEEWIAEVKLATLDNSTAGDNGYGDFTGMDAPQLVQDKRYEIELRPGFSGIPYTEHFTAWIDFNQDGVFDLTEQVFDQGGNNAFYRDSIQIPANAKPGITRLRVAMQFLYAGGPCSFDSNSGGEVEDYCVQIMDKSTPTTEIAKPAVAMQVYPNPFKEQLKVILQFDESQQQAQLVVFNTMGQKVKTQHWQNLPAGTQTIDLDVSKLPAGVYWVQCRLNDGNMLTQRVIKSNN